MVWFRWVLCIGLVCATTLDARERGFALWVETFHSPNRQFTAVVASPKQGGYEEPSLVTLYGPGDSKTTFPLFKGFPERLHVLNDGGLVAVGRRGFFWPETVPQPHLQLITVVDSDGTVRFSADLRDMRRLGATMPFRRASDASPQWYRETRVSPDDRLLTIVLSDVNELHLALDSLELAYVPIPTGMIQDPEELRSRADAYGDTTEGVAILEDIVQRFPGDVAAVYRLRRHAAGEGDHAKAISLLRRLADEHPPGSSGDTLDEFASAIPSNIRRELIGEYLAAGQPQCAMEVIEEVRDHVEPRYLDLLEIETLIELGRPQDADGVVQRWVAREQRYFASRSQYRALVSAYEKHGHHDRIDALVDLLDTDGPAYLQLLEEQIDYLVRNGRDTAAMARLQELMDRGNRTRAARVMGQIHASHKGDIPMDLDRARHWFEFAVESPYAQLGDSQSDVETAIRALCKINLVMAQEGGFDDAATWCERLSAWDATGVRWTAIILLDPAFNRRDVDEGLRLLETVGCPYGGWANANQYFSDDYASNLNAWVARTLELNLGTNNANIQFCLGLLHVGRPDWGTWTPGNSLP